MATLAEGSISTSDLLLYVLDCLFDSFGKETIKTTMMLANFATKLTMIAAVFLIATQTPVVITVTA